MLIFISCFLFSASQPNEGFDFRAPSPGGEPPKTILVTLQNGTTMQVPYTQGTVVDFRAGTITYNPQKQGPTSPPLEQQSPLLVPPGLSLPITATTSHASCSSTEATIPGQYSGRTTPDQCTDMVHIATFQDIQISESPQSQISFFLEQGQGLRIRKPLHLRKMFSVNWVV